MPYKCRTSKPLLQAKCRNYRKYRTKPPKSRKKENNVNKKLFIFIRCYGFLYVYGIYGIYGISLFMRLSAYGVYTAFDTAFQKLNTENKEKRRFLYGVCQSPHYFIFCFPFKFVLFNSSHCL